MAKRNAFTLAEVLITLGIIGVVAAMTLPTLLTSTQAAQFRAQVKKTLAVSSQAVVVNLAMDDFDAGTTTTTSYGHDSDGVPNASLINIFSDRLQVLNKGGEIQTTEAWTNFPATNYTLYLNDGSSITFPKTCVGNTEGNACKGAIDVNGRKKPNLVATCDSGSNDNDCKVKKAYDQYPIHIYDQTIRPGNPAARYVIFKAGK